MKVKKMKQKDVQRTRRTKWGPTYPSAFMVTPCAFPQAKNPFFLSAAHQLAFFFFSNFSLSLVSLVPSILSALRLYSSFADSFRATSQSAPLLPAPIRPSIANKTKRQVFSLALTQPSGGRCTSWRTNWGDRRQFNAHTFNSVEYICVF